MNSDLPSGVQWTSLFIPLIPRCVHSAIKCKDYGKKLSQKMLSSKISLYLRNVSSS